jgi:hypothetical protein
MFSLFSGENNIPFLYGRWRNIHLKISANIRWTDNKAQISGSGNVPIIPVT